MLLGTDNHAIGLKLPISAFKKPDIIFGNMSLRSAEPPVNAKLFLRVGAGCHRLALSGAA